MPPAGPGIAVEPAGVVGERFGPFIVEPVSAVAANQAEEAAPVATTQSEQTAAGPASRPESAVPTTQPAEHRIRFVFSNESWANVLEFFSRISGMSIIGVPSLPGAVNFYSTRSYDLDGAIAELNQLLALNGYHMLREANYLKIVPLTEVRRYRIPIHSGTSLDPKVADSEIVTMVMPVPIKPDLFAAQVTPMLSTFGRITPMGEGQVVIVDSAANIRYIAKMLAAVGKTVPVTSEFRIFPIRHVGAAEITQTILQLTSTPVPVKDNEGRVRYIPQSPGAVLPDQRSNSVLAMSTPDTLKNIESIIQKLDLPVPSEEAPSLIETKIYALTATGVQQAAEVIRNNFGGRADAPSAAPPGVSRYAAARPDIRVTVDVQNRRLIVTATPERHKDIDKLLADLEKVEPTKVSDLFKIVKLRTAQVSQIASLLRRLIPLTEGQRLDIMEEPRTNAVMLLSNAPELVKRAEDYISQLDPAPPPLTTQPAAAPPPPRVIRIVELANVQADAVLRAIQTMLLGPGLLGEPRPIMEPTGAARTLLLSCTDAQWIQIKALIDDLDKPAVGTVTETVRLKNIRPSEMERAVQQFFGPGALAGGEGMMMRRSRGTVRTIADDSRMTLIVDAPAALLADVRALVEKMDVPVEEGSPAQIDTKTYAVKSMEPDRAAEVIRNAFGGRGESAPPTPYAARFGAAQPDIRVTVDVQNRRLIVTATPQRHKDIESLLSIVDQAAGPREDALKIVRLRNAQANQVQYMLRKLVAAQEGQRLEIIEDSRTNSLMLLSGSPELIARAEAFIAQLDVPGQPGADPVATELRTYHADSAQRAFQAVEALKKHLADRMATGQIVADFNVDQPTLTIFITARPDDFAVIEPKLKEVIGQLSDKSILRPFKVRYATASQLASTISNMLSGKPHGAVNPEEQLRLTSDDRTNTLLASGTEAGLKQVENLLAQLDVPPTEAQTRCYELGEGLTADQLARALELSFAEPIRRGAMQARFQPEPLSNSLFVTARADDFAEIDKQVARLKATVKGRSAIRPFKIVTGNAQQIVGMLYALLSGQTSGRPAAEQLRLSADAASNTIFASGATDLLNTVEQLIGDLQKGGPSGPPVMRIVRLASSEPTMLASTIRQALGGDGPYGAASGPKVAGAAARVTADAGSGSLILTGSSAEVAAVEKIVEQLDQGGQEASQIFAYPCKYIWPPDAITMINDLIGKRPVKNAPPLTMSVDSAGQRLFINTTPAQFKVITAFLAQIDAEPIRPIRVQPIPLLKSDPIKVAADLGKQAESKWGKNQAPTFEPDTLISSVIVTGTDEQYDWAAALVDEIWEKYAVADEQLYTVSEIVTLGRGMSAGKTAELLNKLYQQVEGTPVKVIQFQGAGQEGIIIRDTSDSPPAAQPVRPAGNPPAGRGPAPSGQPVHPTGDAPAARPERSGPRSGPTSRPDAGSTSSLSPGFGFGHPGIGALAAETVARAALAMALGPAPDHPNGEPGEVLEPADSGLDGVGSLRIRRPTTQPEGQVRLPPAPTIFVHPETNALIVQGTSSQVSRIKDIIDQLTKSVVAGESEIRIYKLTNASPDEMASILEALFNPRQTQAPGAGQQPQQPQPQQPSPESAARGRFAGRARTGEPPGGGAAPGAPGQQQQQQVVIRRITVVPNLRTNTIVVKAAPADFNIIEPLVRALDVVLPPSVVEVRVFNLQHIDAAEVEVNLKELFRMIGGGGGQETKKELDALRQQVIQMQRQGLVGSDAELLKLVNVDRMTITANRAANSLVVAAPPEGLKFISELLAKIDAAPVIGEVKVKIFPLSNARADQLAPVFQAVFRQRQQQLQGRAGQFGGRRAGGGTTGGSGAAGGPGGGSTPGTPNAAAGAASGGSISDQQMVVAPDPRSNALIVRALAQDMDEIAKLIAELDKTGPNEPVPRIYKLAFAEANALARALEQMYQRTSIRIGPDPSTNALLIFASEPDHLRLAELVKELDVSGERQTALKVYRLETAQADDVARAISGVLGGGMGGGGPGRGQGQGKPQPRVSADPMTNTIVAMATPDDHEQIAAIIKQMDSGELVGRKTVTVALKNASAADLVAAIQPLFGGAGVGGGVRGVRGGGSTAIPLVITAETQSNSLLISGADPQIKDVLDLVKVLDQPGFQGGLKVYQLRFADAASLARALQDVYVGRAGARGGQASSAVRIAADAATNCLLVTASEADHQKLADLIKTLDLPENKAEMRVYPLKLTQADEVARELTSLLAGPSRTQGKTAVRVAADVTTNSLIAIGDAADHQQIEEIIKQLESGKASGYQVRPIPLKFANAADLAASLAPVFAVKRGGGRAGGAADMAIAADSQSNQLLVSGSEAQIKEIVELVKTLDVEIKEGGLKVYQLKFAEAGSLANALREMYRPAAGAKVVSQVKIAADASTNSLLVTAPETDQQKIAETVARMDAESIAVPQARVYSLKVSQAAEMAKALNLVYPKQQRSQAGGRPPPQIAANAMTNALIVVAVPDDQTRIAALIDEVEKGGGAVQTLRPVQLKHARAADVVATLEPLFKPKPQQQQQGVPWWFSQPKEEVATAAPVQLSADARSNTVLIVGTEQQIKDVSDLIAQLDSDQVPSRLSTKIVPLRTADALEIAPTIQKVYDTAMAGMAPTGPGVSKPARVAIGADSRTNAIVLAGPADEFVQLEALIKQLDATPPGGGELRIRVVPLKGSQPEEVKKVIDQLLQGSPTPGRAGGGGGPRPLPGVRVEIATVKGSSSLIISADDKTLDELQKLIDEIEKADAQVPKFFTLVHAEAAKVAAALTQLLKQAQPTLKFSIAAESRTNLLIVTAPDSAIEQIKLLIEKLDEPPPFATAVMMTVPLRHASAKLLATVIPAMLKRDKAGAVTPAAAAIQEQIRRMKVITPEGKPVSELDLDKPINLTAEEGTNSLIISSSAENVSAMAAVLNVMDSLPMVDAVTVRIFPVKHADATVLGQSLTDLFTRTRQLMIKPGTQAPAKPGEVAVPTAVGKALADQATVAVDQRTNTLLAAGTEEAVALVQVLVDQLDIPSIGGGIETRILPVLHGDAGQLAPMLADLFDKRLAASLAPKATAMPADKVAVAVGLTNALIVTGKKENLDSLAELLAKLDVEPVAEMAIVDFCTLDNADADTVAAAVNALFKGGVYMPGRPTVAAAAAPRPEDKVTVQADVRTNVVIVSASKQNLAVIKGLIKQMDVAVPESYNTRLFPVTATDAAKVGQMLQQLFDRKNAALERTGVRAKPVTVISDVRSNTLIVVGNREAFTDIDRLLPELDKADVKGAAEFRLFALKNASAATLGTMLQDMLNRRRTGGAGVGVAGAATTPAVIQPDPMSNSLVVLAGRDDMAVIADLVEQLDKSVEKPDNTRIFPLLRADANAMAATLRGLYANRPDARNIGFSVYATLNALVVSAAKSDMDAIADLINRLDTAEVLEKRDMQYITLLNARADELARTVTDSLRGPTQLAAGVATGQRAVLIKFTAANAEAAQAISTRRDEITITPDVRTNAVLVQAPPESMAMLVVLIKEMDQPERVLTQVEIFKLQNADATQMAAVIAQLFKITTTTTSTAARSQTVQRGQQTPLQQYLFQQPGLIGQPLVQPVTGGGAGVGGSAGGGGQGAGGGAGRRAGQQVGGVQGAAMTTGFAGQTVGAGGAGAQGPAFSPMTGSSMAPSVGTGLGGVGGVGPAGGIGGVGGLGGAGGVFGGAAGAAVTPSGTAPSPYRPELSIVVDTRTNFLIASGVAEDLAVVRDLVEKLDSSDVIERVTRAIAIRHGKSDEIQQAINSLLTQETQREIQLLGSVQSTAVKAIEKQVSVVSVPTSNQVLLSASPKYFEQVAQMIEELDRPPPQVLIQVLLAEVTLDDTFDLGFEAKYDLKVESGLLRAETAFGVAGLQTSNGFAVSLTGTDFEFILRAMQTQKRLEVLSRPQILASDNQEAEINVGSTIPVVTSSQVTSSGQPYTTIDYKDVGIILKVTPKINPDGFVNMLINPEISSISKSTVNVGTGQNLTVVDKRSATTTVTVKDNQTIVIGGLIRTQEGETESKVPILGDLPGLLGAPWRSTQTEKHRTELLIVLTPRVLRTVEDAARVSVEERNRVSVVPRNVESTELHRIRTPMGPPFHQPVRATFQAPGGSEPLPLPPSTAPASQPATPPDEPPPGQRGGMLEPLPADVEFLDPN